MTKKVNVKDFNKFSCNWLCEKCSNPLPEPGDPYEECSICYERENKACENEEVEAALKLDILIFGTSIVRINLDGTKERVPPIEVYK